MTESDLQASIVSSLRKLGYTVLSTSARVSRGIRGVTKGLPDLMVTHRSWETGIWLGLEVKLPKGAIKPEQKELLEAGRIVVVRSWDDAWRAVLGKGDTVRKPNDPDYPDSIITVRVTN